MATSLVGAATGGATVISVVVADDEALVRDGLAAIVSSDPGLGVVATAADGAEAVDAVHRLAPDVVLMDVRMPGMDGIEATPAIAAETPDTRVLILTTVELDEGVYDALRAGASGFLLKSVPRDQLWSGIRAVHAGDALLAPSITRRLIEAHLDRRTPPRPQLLTACTFHPAASSWPSIRTRARCSAAGRPGWSWSVMRCDAAATRDQAGSDDRRSRRRAP
jgi:DNA-binding NarL/FixJ family response regulator